MAGTVLPRTGIVNAWAIGDNFKAEMDANLLKLEIALGGHILDRDLTAPPGAPSAGQCYIPATGSTGDWSGQDGNIAYYDGSAWQFLVPWIGLSVFIADEDVRSTYKVAGWSAGVAC